MRAVVLERNPLVARKVVRALAGAGVAATAVEAPEAIAWDGVQLACADAFDGELVARAAAERGLCGVLWTAEPLRHALRFDVDHVCARKDFESAPRAAELVMIARRLAQPTAPLPIACFLDWGATVREVAVRGSADRDPACAAAGELAAQLHAPRRVAELFAELAHELIMNAVYDAPGTHAHDRKAAVELAPHAQPRVYLGSDGSRLALQIADPFGRLQRAHVFGGLARGLQQGELDTRGGGAGLGLTMVHHAATAMYFDVAPGRHTIVTAVLDLDATLRDLRTAPRSLHWWLT